MEKPSDNQSPRWVEVQYAPDNCSACGKRIEKGEPALYVPGAGELFCKPCGVKNQ